MAISWSDRIVPTRRRPTVPRLSPNVIRGMRSPRRAVTRNSTKIISSKVNPALSEHLQWPLPFPLGLIELILVQIPVGDVGIDTFAASFAIGRERHNFV